MRAIKFMAVAACAAILAGCSAMSVLTGEPTQAQRMDFDTAKAKAEAARADLAKSAIDERRERRQVIATLGASGDGAASDAALVLLAAEERQAGVQQPVAPPSTRPSGGLLREILLPVLGLGAQVYGIHEGAATSRHLSDNATRLGIAQSADHASVLLGSYDALSDTAAQIQAPAGSVEYAIGGDGVIGAGSYATSVSTTTTNTASGAGSSTGGAGSWSTDDHSVVDDHSATAPPTVVHPQVVQVPAAVAP
jgi:hypothetical protein